MRSLADIGVSFRKCFWGGGIQCSRAEAAEITSLLIEGLPARFEDSELLLIVQKPVEAELGSGNLPLR